MLNKLILIFCFLSLGVFSQNTPKKYNLSFLVSSEFYNADFKSLNSDLDSKEMIATSYGLTLNKQDTKSYISLEFKLLRNYSEIININGYALNFSINHNFLKSSKHLLYPKLSFMIGKYNMKLNENKISKSNYAKSFDIGIGYEYIFNINYIKTHINENMKFSIGLNLDKTIFNNKLIWKPSNLNADLTKDIKTKILVRIIF